MFALRGAITVARNEAEEIESAAELLTRTLLQRNGLAPDEIISAFFTSTQDLTAAFPAAGARRAGLLSTALLCAQEIPVPGSLPQVVRVMMHVDGTPKRPVEHVYLREAANLRPDWVKPNH